MAGTIRPSSFSTGSLVISTFKGLMLAVKDRELRTHARAAGELQVEWEGRVWTIVRATAVKSGVLVEYE